MWAERAGRERRGAQRFAGAAAAALLFGAAACSDGTDGAIPPSPEPTPSASAPPRSPSPSPAEPIEPVDARPFVKWEIDLSTELGEVSPWTVAMVDAVDAWLMSAIVGDPEESESSSVLFSVDPATGKVTSPEASKGLPDTIACGAQLVGSKALCLWDGAVHAVDPRTALIADQPFAAPGEADLYGIQVMDGQIVAAGLTKAGAPIAMGFDPTGGTAWSSPFAVDGCYAEEPEATTLVVPQGDLVRIGVGSYQAVVGLATGALLATACGRGVIAEDGAFAVIQDAGDEPAPAESYLGSDGRERRIFGFGQAKDVIALEQAGRSRFAVLGSDDQLRLIDTATGEDVWAQEAKIGQAAFQGSDAERVYYNTVAGLTAVALDTGEVEWRWKPGTGVAFRAAYVSPDRAIVAASSASLDGVSPSTGRTVWSLEAFAEAAWYWVPPNGMSDPGPLVMVGPARDHVTRIDPPLVE